MNIPTNGLSNFERFILEPYKLCQSTFAKITLTALSVIFEVATLGIPFYILMGRISKLRNQQYKIEDKTNDIRDRELFPKGHKIDKEDEKLLTDTPLQPKEPSSNNNNIPKEPPSSQQDHGSHEKKEASPENTNKETQGDDAPPSNAPDSIPSEENTPGEISDPSKDEKGVSGENQEEIEKKQPDGSTSPAYPVLPPLQPSEEERAIGDCWIAKSNKPDFLLMNVKVGSGEIKSCDFRESTRFRGYYRHHHYTKESKGLFTLEQLKKIIPVLNGFMPTKEIEGNFYSLQLSGANNEFESFGAPLLKTEVPSKKYFVYDKTGTLIELTLEEINNYYQNLLEPK